MRKGQVGNNWFPLLCLSLLFLFVGAASMMAVRGNGSSVASFETAFVLAGLVIAGWLWRNPSPWPAEPKKKYLYLLAGTVVGVFLFGLIPFFNGCGPWIVVGAALTYYGVLERFRLLITTGAVVAATGGLAMVHADVWGGALHLLTAVVLAFAANRLYVLKNGKRREERDADPGFIGAFEEFDADEPPVFWNLPKR